MAFAPDGRLFVCLQGGQVRVIKNGALLATPFLSLTVNSSGERGLLGIAFDPNFTANQFVYIYYTATTPTLHNRISRFTANGDVAAAGSEVIVLDLNNLSSATNHNGGAIHFGEDGKLYAAVGDNANGANSQSLSNLLGKMLRINSDGTIPADNPFFNQATGQNRAIWALGLRNPFTFAFQPMTARMFINDVGQNTFEEINDGLAGANYGWPESEGPTSNPNHTGPIYHYGHGTGPFLGCAITGGAFYNPAMAQFPAEYAGDFFFADFCGGWINKFDPANSSVTTFASGISSPVDLQVSSDGSLYYLARGSGGVVYRIQFAGSQAPTITQHPQSQTVAPGQPVTFTVTASGTPPLTYQWQRNGVNIPRATSSSYTIKAVTANDNGALFRCVVSNASGSVISNEALLTVSGGGSNVPPTAEANGPYSGGAGGRILFSSAGSTDSDGSIVSYSWNFGDGTPPSSQPNPRHNYSSPGTYTATLTVTDDDGATGTDTAQVTVK
jgi:glucose/arabinose dehydrogenase